MQTNTIAAGRDQIRYHDAIFFGAVGTPDVPDHITLWGLRLAICQPFDQYANVRPTRILPGIVKPPSAHRRGKSCSAFRKASTSARVL